MRLGTGLAQELANSLVVLNKHLMRDTYTDENMNAMSMSISMVDSHPPTKSKKAHQQRASVIFEDVQQSFYRQEFKVFMGLISDSPLGKVSITEETMVFERLLALKDDVNS